jgi:hypothetical protein
MDLQKINMINIWQHFVIDGIQVMCHSTCLLSESNIDYIGKDCRLYILPHVNSKASGSA